MILRREEIGPDRIVVDCFPLVGRTLVAIGIALIGFILLTYYKQTLMLGLVPTALAALVLMARHELRISTSERHYYILSGLAGVDPTGGGVVR